MLFFNVPCDAQNWILGGSQTGKRYFSPFKMQLRVVLRRDVGMALFGTVCSTAQAETLFCGGWEGSVSALGMVGAPGSVPNGCKPLGSDCTRG